MAILNLFYWIFFIRQIISSNSGTANKTQLVSTSEEDTIIAMPTFDAILGDKLTAFAPKTTGILYSKNRSVEIIKQLY
jgi:hypothetical protein